MFFLILHFSSSSYYLYDRGYQPPSRFVKVPTNIYINSTESYSARGDFPTTYNQAFVHLKRSRIEHMYDPYYGGGIFCIYSHVLLESSEFSDNYAPIGGSMFLYNSDLVFNGGSVFGSVAHFYAGGICYVNSKSQYFSNTIPTGSQFASNYHFARLNRVYFTSCFSKSAYGGALFYQANNVLLEYCQFHYCSSIFRGGALGLVGISSNEKNDDDDDDEEISAPLLFNTTFTDNGLHGRTRGLNKTMGIFGEIILNYFPDVPSFRNKLWVEKNIDNRILKGGGCIFISNYSYLFTQYCSITNSRINNSEKIKQYPGIDIYFYNVDTYYSYGDTRFNLPNLIESDFDNDGSIQSKNKTEIIIHDCNYVSHPSYTPRIYKETNTFTPMEIIKVNKVFPTENNKIEPHIDQTPFQTKPERSPYPSNTKLYEIPPLYTVFKRTINLFFYPEQTPSLSSTPEPSPEATETPKPEETPTPKETPEPTKTPTESPTLSPFNQVNSMSYVLTWTYIRSVSFSGSYIFSNYVTYIFVNNEYSVTHSGTSVISHIPYIITFLVPSYSETEILFQRDVVKKYLSPQQLIGVVCGSVAVFFLILAIIVLVYQKRKMPLFSDLTADLLSESEEEDDDGPETAKGAQTTIGISINDDHDNQYMDNWL